MKLSLLKYKDPEPSPVFPTPFVLAQEYLLIGFQYWSQARKTESSLQKIRLGAQRRAGASSDISDHNISDTDKICMQLFLDIQVTNMVQ